MNKIIFQEKKDISPFLSIRTPLIAEKFTIAKTREDLIFVKRLAIREKKPLLILGGGTNIVAFSKFFPGIVVKNEYRKFSILENKENKVKILVSSGYPVSILVKETIDQGFSGLEYFYGLPGTVGGAIFMNSKWMQPEVYFGDNLLYAYLIDNKGEIKKVNKDYFIFGYDFSILQKTKEILLEIVIILKKNNNRQYLEKKLKKAFEYRLKNQPKKGFSAGCFFRNIDQEKQKKLNLPSKSAGYLIDKAGLKGLRVGGFYVSDIHANFIINDGTGKNEELKEIVSQIKDKVKRKFGIELKEEVVII